MIRNLMIAILAFAMITACFTATAQIFKMKDVKNQMIKDWMRAKDFTLAYVQAMPADKFAFKPVDSVQSFAQQMIHLAVVDMFLVSTASGTEPSLAGWADFGITTASQTKDSVIYYVTASYDYCVSTITALDPKVWSRKKKLSGKQKTSFELIENAFEHQSHHRGQTAIYLRLLGIVPPEANLF